MTGLACMVENARRAGIVIFATAHKQAFRGPHVEMVRKLRMHECNTG